MRKNTNSLDSQYLDYTLTNGSNLRIADFRDVIAAYQYLLGRDQENNNVIEDLVGQLSVWEIRKRFMASREYNDNKQRQISSSPPSPSRKTRLSTFSELDVFIATLDRLETTDEHDWLEYRLSHFWDIDAFLLEFRNNGGLIRENDPFLESDYFSKEVSFFEFLCGKTYTWSSEGLSFDVDSFLAKLPFSAYRNYLEQTVAGVKLIDFLRPKKGEKVLELGYGRGNTLELFGRIGCQVSGVDASPSFRELSFRRCTMQNISIGQLECGPFASVEYFGDKYSYVVFDASFHHCTNPIELLSILRKKIHEDGKIIFIREPISKTFKRPWGIVRSDGETIYQIRKRACFEIGIREDFFLTLLEKTGYKILDIPATIFDTPPLFIATPV